MGADLPSEPRRKRGAKPEINITPLVDVVLVLLIIFMVVTSQMEAGMSVALPAVAKPDAATSSAEPTTITLARNGKLYLEKDEVEYDALVARLQALHAARPDAVVVLKADVGLEYGKVRSMFKTCQDLGFAGAALQVLDQANKKG
jgi:biopolymer transport protein TolR